MILSDKDILSRLDLPAGDPRRLVIEPFSEGVSGNGVISHGLSSYGYDMRIGRKFKVFTNAPCGVVDPKNFEPQLFVNVEADVCFIPPNGFILGESVEYFEIPRDILVLCVGKSTYARCGLVVNVTPLEAEWRGTVTIEISNTTSLPAKVYANEGIAQLLFLKGESVCRVSYADKQGKYQGQQGVTVARVL